MSTHAHYHSTHQQQAVEKKAIFLEWITIIYLLTLVPIMFVVMGSSQAMKTAWIEDILSFIPPVVFLVTNSVRKKKSTEEFPRGFARATSIGYFIAAISLISFGLILVANGSITLVSQERPVLAYKEYFGLNIWEGWWMLLVLLYSGIPPLFLGRQKLKLAHPIHDNILYTDAIMNKADWMSTLATGCGVIGIGLGFWWADALAAIIVSIDITHDGWKQLKDATTELIGRAPKSLEGDFLNLPHLVKKEIESLAWIKSAQINMYEHGRLIYVEISVIPEEDFPFTQPLVKSATDQIKKLNWRIEDVDFALDPERKS